MNKENNKLEKIGTGNPFKVPEGYFDNLTENIMSRLPERIAEEQKPISLWKRVEPWVYMAAMFAGIAMMIRLFVGSPQPEKLNLTSSAEIEDFYQYYEEQLANAVYRETFYLDVDEENNWQESDNYQ